MIYLENKLKRINDNLFYREELFNSLCNNVDDVYIICDIKNKKFEYISPNFEKILGFSEIELSTNFCRLLQYINVEWRYQIYEMFSSSSIKSNTEIEFEYDHPHLQQKRWMLIRNYPAFNHNHLVRYIISIVDVTEKYKAQEALKEASMNAQKANEAKKEFLSHMSHELKTPINAIVGMAQIATKSLTDPVKVENCLNKIDTASSSLLDLINNILTLAKLDSDKILLIREPINLHNSLNYVSSIMNSQAEVNNQVYNMILHNINEEYVIGDELRLMQILNNCLSNSLKFTPSGGIITLEVSELSRSSNKVVYRFIVTDNGKGMSVDYMERIFIPFEQEDSSIAQIYGGTGLGMSISKNLVDLMGGTIHVSSKVGIGTCVTIDIGFDLLSPDTEQLIPEQSNPNFTTYNSSGKRVLVVEDNEINLEITCEFLKYINISVEAASNGQDAITLFNASEPGYYDAILMDLQMPGLNGYDTTKAIRNSSHPDASNVCIIAMTADNFADDRSSLDCGMNYHITKPIDIDKLNLILHNTVLKEERSY
jgi:PAS domain S-box-containing protein